MRVGVFDSGLGGLTIVQAMMRHLKGAQIHYIADTKHAPYGEKSQKQIIRYTLEITEYFIDKHKIDALVVACNTATTAAIETLRQHYPKLIIVGTEPGIKPAIEATKNDKIGILATPATLKSNKYRQLADRLAADNKIRLYEQACPGLVEQIEQGLTDTQETYEMLEGWLCDMRESGVDTIVLGCTHYPIVSEPIGKLMDHRVSLIHTGDAITKHLLTLAQEQGHRNEGPLSLFLYTTGDINKNIVTKILDKSIPIQKINSIFTT